MSTDEHVPPTDEELAETERSLAGFDAEQLWLDIRYGELDREDSDEIARRIEFIPRLIAEVRRLRNRIADLEMAFKLEFPRAAMATDERVVELSKNLDKARRTLTLANGTVVRAGDVLVGTESYHDGSSHTSVIKVTAIGESSILAKNISHGWSGGTSDIPAKVKPLPFCEKDRSWTLEYRDWRPWSEVYPDRPAPGGESQ